MNRIHKYMAVAAVAITAAMLSAFTAKADEGMWMIHTINKALEKNMKARGLKLSAGEIYNADAEGASISDAIVSLDFGCTGSIISDKGLLITNHHCAFSDIHSLSTDEHNYLEEGFWAMRDDEEIHIPGKRIFFLKKVLDVTDEVNGMLADAEKNGTHLGSRKLSFMMEKKYKAESGYEAWFSSMWKGSKYYVALYEVYSDIRLVAAPPVSIAAFGGDIDNWEWPQHKGDFAMYRVYTAPDGKPAGYSKENIPLKPKRKLEISLDGYKPGDYTMILGYPGRTERYSSSFAVNYDEKVALPISNRLRKEQMAIINEWMGKDPAIRLKYSDIYFGLSNVQELNEGEVQCFGRFGVVKAKKEEEKELQAWIDADPERKARWGTLLDDMETKYSQIEDIKRNTVIYRETLVRGSMISRTYPKINNLRSEVLKGKGIRGHRGAIRGEKASQAEKECCGNHRFCGKRYASVWESLAKAYEGFVLDVEKDLFRYSVEQFYSMIDPEWVGEYQKELQKKYTAGGKCDYDALTSYLWDNTILTDTIRLNRFIAEEHTLNDYFQDPLYRFFQDVRITDFNWAVMDIEGDKSILSLEKEYTHAMYQMRMDKGIEQYPDANSTMRLTYGTVGGIEPYDGMRMSWHTTTAGILEKYNPQSYEFNLDERQKGLLEAKDWGRWGISGRKGSKPAMYVDFLTDNDITGGNSGSPVLNAKGQLIGLAFDGNKESLAGNAAYVDGYNKCVCVDIRYILWVLDKYAGMDRIIGELGL